MAKVDLRLQTQAYRKAFYKVRRDYQLLLDEQYREREAEKRRLRKNVPEEKQEVLESDVEESPAKVRV